MREIGSNPLGTFNPSGLVNMGESYHINNNEYATINGEFQINAGNYPYYIFRSPTNQNYFFPVTTRSIQSGTNFITISQSSGINKELNDFLSGIYGYRHIGSAAWPKSASNYPSVTFPNSDIPQARDALAYNLIKNVKPIPPVHEWKWFKVSNSLTPTGIFGICSGPRPSSRAGNYNGYYTNIYNMFPFSGESWLYNYTTPHTFTTVNLINNTVTAFGGITWLISGRSSVYIKDGRPIYWQVTGYDFDKSYHNTNLVNISTMTETSASSSNLDLGLPPSGSKYLDIQCIHGANIQTFFASYNSRFFWSGNISRWVFNPQARGCTSNASNVQAFITGLNSTEFPWETNWPSGIFLTRLN